MEAIVTIQIQNKHKEEFSKRMLDDSKRPVCFTKKNATMSPVKMQHITSNIISLHDKNLNKAVEIGITFIHIFEANWPEGFLDPITKQIVTFTWVGKPLKLGTETVYRGGFGI